MTKKNDILSRIALFIIFFWFGFIKILGQSPANGLVESLLEKTMPFIPSTEFILFLGVWEAAIGVLFLFPKITKIAFWIMAVQMCTTFGPLLLLPDATWQSFAIPTLEGQYIIKNLALIAIGITVYHNQNHSTKKIVHSIVK